MYNENIRRISPFLYRSFKLVSKIISSFYIPNNKFDEYVSEAELIKSAIFPNSRASKVGYFAKTRKISAFSVWRIVHLKKYKLKYFRAREKMLIEIMKRDFEKLPIEEKRKWREKKNV